MAQLLLGKQVAAKINRTLMDEVRELKDKGIKPSLAMLRIGERDDDLAYERAIQKKCDDIGVSLRKYILQQTVEQKQLLHVISEINRDATIHGILIFLPLPEHLNEELVRQLLSPEKDVDGITYASMSGVYADKESGFPPCTAQACIEILDYYGIDLTGKHVTIVGRSLVVGKPAAMLALKKNATVSICHSKTKGLDVKCREADILIVATGKTGVVNKNCFNKNQIVIDVGIHADENGNIIGDVPADEAEPIVKALTPVPGGVGSITSTVLLKHVIEAAKRTCR